MPGVIFSLLQVNEAYILRKQKKLNSIAQQVLAHHHDINMIIINLILEFSG